jgi:DNA-binding transcriptional ArsR family regulator
MDDKKLSLTLNCASAKIRFVTYRVSWIGFWKKVLIMDDVSATLIPQLLDKALENIKTEDRLAFVEKLFAQLPPAGQQEVLLGLTRMLLESGTKPAELQGAIQSGERKPVKIAFIQGNSEDFAPGQICCEALTGFANAPEMDEKQVLVIAQMFNGLADETRVKIIKLLSKGEFTVDEIVEFLGIAQSTTSHHLKILKQANLINGQKRGRNIYYSLVRTQEAAAEKA